MYEIPVDNGEDLRYRKFIMKRFFLLTVLLGLASPAWAQYYDDNGQAAMIQQDQQMRMENQMMYQQQQIQAQQQQMQDQINRQQQEINNYNSASGMERLTGNY